MNTEPRVFRFSSTGVAYDHSQVLDHIRDGDVLSVPDEMVVGVLIEAWPVSIKPNCGQFHTLELTSNWEAIPSMTDGEVKDYSASYAAALKEYNRIRYEARKGK